MRIVFPYHQKRGQKVKQRSHAELHGDRVFLVTLAYHRWIPFDRCELAIKYGSERILTDYGTAVLDISSIPIDFGGRHGRNSIQEHLSKKVHVAVDRHLAASSFRLRVTHEDAHQVHFTLETVSAPLRELSLPAHFVTSVLTFSRIAATVAPVPEVVGVVPAEMVA